MGDENLGKTNDVIRLYNKLSEENKRKFMSVLSLVAKEGTSHTAQAASSSLQTRNQ